jgi:glycosyltransferase involved in cell wall biosynthesis
MNNQTRTTAPPFGLVSVIICNHDYARFLPQAIESALGLDWPELEVIVVDDGSTDDSREVMARYADRVTVVHQPNSGQWAACNTGFARSRGEVVIFLDSDDVLAPSVLREVAAVWRLGISKVQFQMKVVDEHGVATGAVLPQFHRVPSSADIRSWALHAASYPTPPGSGNVYARTFLDKLFPLSGGDRAADSYCLAAAPYLGDVVTIAKPLVSYRVHGRNQGAMASLDARRFGFELKRAQFRLSYARQVAGGIGVPSSDDVLTRSLSVLPYRLASLKLLPEEHPIKKDSSWRVLRDLTAACFVPQGVTPRARAVLWVWAVSVAVSPRNFGQKLALWRFSSASRPEILKRSLRMLRVVKRYDAAA